ncbi:cupin domain-containing protein [Bacteroidota bacterium]
MKRRSDIFLKAEKIQWEDLGGGVQRQFLGWDNQAMMVKVRFETGAVGAPHQHFQTQVSYCESGKFELTVDGDKQVLEEGDGFYIPPNALHGAVCLEAGMLIDVFSPVREDFLDGSAVIYLGDKK